MLFNSINYLLFLTVIVITYYFLPYKFRNLLLLFASFYFYLSWNVKYGLLMIIVIITTFFSGLFIDFYKNKKNHYLSKISLIISITINLLFLFYFKYFNFILQNIDTLFLHFEIGFNFNPINIILPVGISFYIFQALSYVIDVYRGDISVIRSFLKYSLFVSFFPQLVAGPIERSTHLYHQFDEIHSFEYSNFVAGFRTILIGFFKKIVIADTAAIFVNAVFNNIDNFNGLIIIFALLLFAIQIYTDFSGYSDIAIGSARLLGFNLSDNFKAPYFSKTISEFWSRWHISLTSWFRDYLYIPLGGNKRGFKKKLVNLLIVFALSGLWHGAKWTFILWGILHAIYRIIEELQRKYSSKFQLIKFSKIKLFEYLRWLINLIFIIIAWLFFRANNLTDLIIILKNIFISSNINGYVLQLESIFNGSIFYGKLNALVYFIIITSSSTYLFWIDYKKYKNPLCNDSGEYFKDFKKHERWLQYWYLAFLIVTIFISQNAGLGGVTEFIYFQF